MRSGAGRGRKVGGKKVGVQENREKGRTDALGDG